MGHKVLIISLLLLSATIEFKFVLLLKKRTSSDSDRPYFTLLITAITYGTLAHRRFWSRGQVGNTSAGRCIWKNISFCNIWLKVFFSDICQVLLTSEGEV